MNTETALPPVEKTTGTPSPAPVETGAAPVTDSIGRTFDPAKHRTLPNGLPDLDSMKRFKPVKAGRAKADGSPNKTGGGSTDRAPDMSDIDAAARVETDARAAVAANGETPISEALKENATAETIIGAIQTGLVFVGDSEGILTDMEKVAIRRPLVRVLTKWSISENALPPEADLAVAVLTVVIVRLTKPKTATWFARAKMGVVNWWIGRKGRKLARDVRAVTDQAEPAAAASRLVEDDDEG